MYHLGYLAFILVGLVACSSGEDWIDDSSIDFRVSHYETRLTSFERQLWLFVLDDADTPEARSLREQIAAAVRLPEGGPYEPAESICPGDTADPAHLDPIDVRAAVAHPSKGTNRWTTPAEVPALAWLGERDDLAAYGSWLSAVRAELVREPGSSESSAYSPLETIHSELSLLSGGRGASTPAESAALDALETTRPVFVQVFAATSRDDQSPGSVADYPMLGFNQLDAASAFFYELRTLFASAPGTYLPSMPLEGIAPDFPRWFEFTNLLEPEVLQTSSAPDQLFASGLLAKRVMPCWSSPPVRDDQGSVSCRIHVVTDALSPCDAARGWLDPLVGGATDGRRAPRFETDTDGTKQRVCEIQQLEGEPLTQCLLQLDSPPTESGWCYPEPSEECRQLCPSTGAPIAFRFTGGSTRATAATLRLRYDCLL